MTSVLQKEQLASTPEPPLPKGKGTEPSVQSPWRMRGRSKREHEEERVDSTLKEGRFQRRKGGQARRVPLEQVEGSMSG